VSAVSAQPLSSIETRTGAIRRAQLALKAEPTAEFGVGLEGGIEQVDGAWYESGFIAVIDRSGKIGTGTSARYEVSESVAQLQLVTPFNLLAVTDSDSSLLLAVQLPASC
jgi:non-canonical (house-cleaning) NTP pyrophosphatase